MYPLARENKDVAIQRIMDGLKCSREEAESVYEYDKAVDHDEKTAFDLPPDKAKVAQKMAHTGTRKAPMIPRLTPRERKPNATKGAIIANLTQFLEEMSDFDVKNLQIVNKERQIAFEIGEDKFELTLVQKRKPKN